MLIVVDWDRANGECLLFAGQFFGDGVPGEAVSVQTYFSFYNASLFEADRFYVCDVKKICLLCFIRETIFICHIFNYCIDRP